MKAGQIVLARIQQADGQLKTRPVLVLCRMPPFSDCLVCALSSILHHECVGFDEIIDVTDHDFSGSGLKVPSLIRLELVATIPAAAVLGELGIISEERLIRLRARLARHIESGRR